MDFTTQKNSKSFTVDGQKFETKGALAAGVVFQLKNAFTGLSNSADGDTEAAFQVLKSMYARILTDESYARFEPLIAGTCDDDTTPIDAVLLAEITRYLISSESGKESTQPQSS